MTAPQTDARPLAPPGASHCYRLYISSASPASSRALVNARRFFELHQPGAYTLEVREIIEHVSAAREDQIVATPTLLRIEPAPRLRFIGDLSNTERLNTALGIRRADASSRPT